MSRLPSPRDRLTQVVPSPAERHTPAAVVPAYTTVGLDGAEARMEMWAPCGPRGCQRGRVAADAGWPDRHVLTKASKTVARRAPAERPLGVGMRLSASWFAPTR